MRKLCTLSLLLSSALFSEPQKIEIVSHFVDPDVQHYTGILQASGSDLHVVKSGLGDYPMLAKNRSRFGRIIRKFSLDFPRSVPLKTDVAKVIFFNIGTHYRRDLSLKKLPKEKLVLFMWEPPIVLRKMYGSRVKECFSRIYTWDDSLVDNITYFKMFYPVMHPMIETVVPFSQKKLCTLVGTNITSKYPSSLYGERRKAIEFFEAKNEEGFEFYGRRWDPKKYKSYRGEIGNKIDVIKNYRFSICYENSQNVMGYITEKIFDCFTAGNVPIYWGADNVTDYIPKDCFIDRRDFATLDDLYVYLKSMKESEYDGYIERIRDFLKSDRAQLFSGEHFDQTFVEAATS